MSREWVHGAEEAINRLQDENITLRTRLSEAEKIIKSIERFDEIDKGKTIRCTPTERYYKIMRWVRRYRRRAGREG